MLFFYVLIWRCQKLSLTVTLTSTIQTRPRLCRAVVPRVCAIWWRRCLVTLCIIYFYIGITTSAALLSAIDWQQFRHWPSWEPSRPFPVLLTLSLPCFFYKKAPTPIGPPHFKLLPSSLDLDLAIWFLLLIQKSESLASFFSRSRSSYGAKNRSCRVQSFAFLSSSSSSISQLLEEFLWYGWLGCSSL
jgi:hypothetical protein